jgi:hypothetical protein
MTEKSLLIPNFLIVGASKSGTSSLAQYLNEHPEAFIPRIKEPVFFVSSFYERELPEDPLFNQAKRESLVGSWDEYINLFQGTQGKKAIGEASTAYLYLHQQAVPKIRKYLGDPRIIIILRNPVDRAFSAYLHVLRESGWTMTFEEYLGFENEKIARGWSPLHYPVQSGHYSNQVKAYMEAFSQVRVYLFDDLCQDPIGFMQQVFRFLEIDDRFQPESSIRWNIGGIPSNRVLYKFLFKSWIMRRAAKPFLALFVGDQRIQVWKEKWRKKIVKTPEVSPETRRHLLELFHDDIEILQDLIDRDLSTWSQGAVS